MKIAYVCLDPGIPIPSAKGASVHVLAITRALAKAGHTVTLFARAGDAASLPRLRDGLAVRYVAGLDGLADAIAGHDLVIERLSLEGTAGLDAARAASALYFLEVNAPLLDEAERYRNVRPSAEQRRAEARLFSEADRVLAVSSELARIAVKRGAAPNRVRLFRNAVDADAFATAPPVIVRGIAADDHPIAFVSGLRPWHGVAHLLEAFDLLWKRDPTYSLIVLGEGPLAADVDRFSLDRPSGESIVRTGRLPTPAVPGVLAVSRVGVCPYEDLAGFYFCPLKVFEYMAAGLPVVASRVGDLPEILGDGERGVLVPPGDPYALAAAVSELREDPDRARALAEAGRAYVVASETWNHRARSIEAMAAEQRSSIALRTP